MWERTNVTNLLRNRVSGTYYARVKVRRKQKWRTLETTLFSVAKLRLGDTEKEIRSHAQSDAGEPKTAGLDEMMVGHFISAFEQRTNEDASIVASTKERRLTALKAVTTTWPDLRGRDVRRISPTDCRRWAATAFREGTGFVAPNAKTKRKGMAGSSFNKTVDALRAVFEIARDAGIIYKNPAAEIAKAPVKKKQLQLPTTEQFQAIVRNIAKAGSKWSQDCADLVRLLAYSGMRLREATAFQWNHVDTGRGKFTVPGTKTVSSYRTVPLFAPLAALLREIRSRRGEEPKNTPVVAVDTCKGALASACAAVGVPKMTHHDLRHLFATRCIECGVDIPTVSRWLGHSDGGTLAMQTYGHLRQEHSQAQAAKVSF